MKIMTDTVAKANARSLQETYPKAAGESDDAYLARVRNLGIVTVDPDGVESSRILVRFDVNTLWIVRDQDPPNVLTLLQSLLPTATSLAMFSVNGAPFAGSILSGVGDTTAVLAKMLSTQQPIEKSLSLRVASEPVDKEEHYRLSVTVTGSTLTTDNGSNEHACLPIMKFRYMDERKKDTKFNVGLDTLALIDADYDFPCKSVKPQMVSTVDLRAVLQTDGDLVIATLGLVSLPTVSAVALHRIEFEYTQCTSDSQTGMKSEAPGGSHHEVKPNGSPPPDRPLSKGGSASSPSAGLGTGIDKLT